MIKTVWILTFRADKDRDEVSRWWRTDPGVGHHHPNCLLHTAQGCI